MTAHLQSTREWKEGKEISRACSMINVCEHWKVCIHWKYRQLSFTAMDYGLYPEWSININETHRQLLWPLHIIIIFHNKVAW